MIHPAAGAPGTSHPNAPGPTRGARAVPRLGRLAGLDGLRAIAVIAVVVYHAAPGSLPGGFLGVEVFFVISGYLITALLLAEHAATGRIDLAGFWARRARRLLPAVFALLVATLAFAVVVLPDEVAALRRDALAAVAYVTNWHLVLSEQSYFETTGRPSLFLHLWSLAIEEQFYLAWPLVLGVALLAGRRVALLVAVAGAAASALWMAALFVPDGDPSRVYYGTDTRLTGLLLGAALAFVWVPSGDPRPRWRDRRLARLLDGVAVASVAALAVLFVLVDHVEPFVYLGGFTALAVVTVALIAAAVHPLGLSGRLLDRQPLRWVGTRSYSIYLWHWPVFALTRPGLDLELAPPAELALRIVLTAALAEVSYRFVETPVRSGALGRLRDARRRTDPTAPALVRWSTPAAAAGAGALSVLLVSVALATPPRPPDYLAGGSVDAVLTPAPAPTSGPSSDAGTTPSPPPSRGPATDPVVPGGTTPGDGAPAATASPASSDRPLPSPTAGSSPSRPQWPDVEPLAFGDSVFLTCAPWLANGLGPLAVDAQIGRQIADGIAALETRAAAGSLPSVVFVQLGNNGPFRRGQFDSVMEALREVSVVIWVNLRVPRDWEERNNGVIARGLQQYPSARLVDWNAATAGASKLFFRDGYHPRPEGCTLLAELIAEAAGLRQE